MRKLNIKKGDKFNFLTAVKFSHKNKWGNKFWLFKCDCGVEKVIVAKDIIAGHTKSCGCLRKKMLSKKNKTHGMRRTKIYNTWSLMKARCLNKNSPNYRYYGGRGITICAKWLTFENFYKDMGNVPKGKSLDRKNNNKGYCKSNCKWSTPKEQANNRGNSHLLTYKGKTQTISQWAEELGIKCHTLYSRINNYNWDVEKALKA